MELETARLRPPCPPGRGRPVRHSRRRGRYALFRSHGPVGERQVSGAVPAPAPAAGGYALGKRCGPGLAGDVLSCPLDGPWVCELGRFLRRARWGGGMCSRPPGPCWTMALAHLVWAAPRGGDCRPGGTGQLLEKLGITPLGSELVTDCRGKPAVCYPYAVTAQRWRNRPWLPAN